MIPVSEPLLDKVALSNVAEAMSTGWISSGGRYIEQFEQSWAAYCGANYGVAVSNGTTALKVAVAALDLEPGSEIIVPTYTIISCVNAILEAGCKPVLIDSDADTWNLTVSQIEPQITERTRAIMVVHMFGHPVDMDPLMDIARRHKLFVIEDAAESHGAEYKGRRVGAIGDIGCFSFYANKIITTGEGGMVIMKDQGLAERSRSLRNLAFRSDRRFLHTEIGYNFRLTNLQAAVGVAQVGQVDRHIEIKRRNAKAYIERLRDIDAIRLPVEYPWAKNVYWMFGIVLDDKVKFDATEGIRKMAARGVETRPFFWPMHEQPVFHRMGLFENQRFPVAERIARRGFYLPSGLTLTEEQIDLTCDALRDCLN